MKPLDQFGSLDIRQHHETLTTLPEQHWMDRFDGLAQRARMQRMGLDRSDGMEEAPHPTASSQSETER